MRSKIFLDTKIHLADAMKSASKEFSISEFDYEREQDSTFKLH
jgi:hypothetical protein